MPLAYIKLLEGSDDEIDNSLPGGRPPHIGGGPIVLPPLPGIWPPPGKPNWPPSNIDPGYGQGRPPHISGGPIFIHGSIENPIVLPPGVWPPFNPSDGIEGKVAILILVLGVGYKWLIYEAPPLPQPK